MKRKQFKQLGDPTVQAAELATTIKALSSEELLALAQRKRAELEEAGEIDEVGDEQPEDAPTLDDSMVGTEVEVCWRYWRPPTDEEKAAGEKRKKIGEKIWCEGKVEQVANGMTDKESVRCKNLLKAGALRIRWPADPVRKELETLSWHHRHCEHYHHKSKAVGPNRVVITGVRARRRSDRSAHKWCTMPPQGTKKERKEASTSPDLTD